MKVLRLAAVSALFASWGLCAEGKKPPAEPRLTSLYPLSVPRGKTTNVQVRGSALGGARAVVFNDAGISARIVKLEPGDPADVVHVEFTVVGSAQVGGRALRVVASAGVTNEIPVQIVEGPTAAEEEVPAVAPGQIVNGRLASRGEMDQFWIQAKAGQTLTFEARSGFPGFDTALALAEPSGSWFDESRLNRVAFNDEPLHFPGLANEARLVHRFAKEGKYALQMRAFSGQGGPDYSYSLRIVEGETPAPALHPKPTSLFEERRFTRGLSPNWIAQLHERGLAEPPAQRPETFRSGLISIPAFVEGRIAKPAETHSFTVKIDKPQDLAIEIETPEATMPLFNPVVRLMDARGNEIVTNVYTKRNNNGLYMMKMIQAKSTVTLRSAGEYTLQIRDITTDRAGSSFLYRVLLRPQVPHIGKVVIADQPINLEPGKAKAVSVQVAREEEFKGFVAVSAGRLPAGVSVVTAMANPVDRPPLPNAGRLERYVGREQSAGIMLVAAPDAPLTELPVTVKVQVRPVVDGRVGNVIAEKEIPVMVVPKRPS